MCVHVGINDVYIYVYVHIYVHICICRWIDIDLA